MNGLLDKGALELARLVRSREVSPLEVVDLHIARIEQVNPTINAVVADRFEAARIEARLAAEQLVTDPDPPPLLGVPCTIKEFIGVEGMPQTAGIVHRWDAHAERDATVVRRLRQAGAIVLGVTNAPEGGLWIETNNLIYGRTTNPWDTAHTAGGSSGGEGAIIAAGGSPFGIGSDVGGSIRIPAAFCGVCGHKPTSRVVPNTGHWPPASGQTGGYLCIGPLARKVEDLAAVLQIIQGPDGHDPMTQAPLSGRIDQVDLRQLEVYPIERIGRAHASVRGAVRSSTAALESRGARTLDLVEPRFRESFNIWSSMLAEGAGESYATLLGNGRPIPVMREVMRFPFGRSNHTTPALALVVLEALQRQVRGRVHAYVKLGQGLRDDLSHTLGPNGVLVLPAYSRAAPRHRASMLTPFDFVYTAIFNVLGLPATVVPVGFDAHGLPLAVQVVAGPHRDHVALAAAQAIEAALGGWQRANPADDGDA